MRRTPGPCLRGWSPANRIALLRQLGSLGIGRRLKSAPAGPERYSVFALSGEKGKLRGWTGADNEIRDWIALAIPNAKQHHFRSCRIPENVINARTPFDFKEAGPARVWPRRGTGMKQHAQLSNLLLRMISQVFHEGRVFCNCHHHVHSPPHSAYRYPHQLRRKKPGKVSWAATSFAESSAARRAAGMGNGANIGDLVQIRRLEGWSKLVRRRIWRGADRRVGGVSRRPRIETEGVRCLPK